MSYSATSFSKHYDPGTRRAGICPDRCWAGWKLEPGWRLHHPSPRFFLVQ